MNYEIMSIFSFDSGIRQIDLCQNCEEKIMDKMFISRKVNFSLCEWRFNFFFVKNKIFAKQHYQGLTMK